MPGKWTPMTRNSWMQIAVCTLLGLLIGYAATTVAYSNHWIRIRGQRAIARMDRRLKLTPAQREKIEEVMRETRARTEQLRHEFHSRRTSVIRGARDEIRSLLTPEQQDDYDRFFGGTRS